MCVSQAASADSTHITMAKLILGVALVYFLLPKMESQMERHEADQEYDFIVVGSGPAGSVIANRLSESRNVKVLLLEAGRSDSGNPKIHIPMKSGELTGTSIDWQYRTVPQKQFGNNVREWPRGKVLGGTSSINYHAYVRGSPHDYDSWRDNGAEGWDHDSVKPYFHRVENATMQKMSEDLGRNGTLKLIRNYLCPTPMSALFHEAAEEIGMRTADYNDFIEGLSHVTYAVHHGIRQSASRAYLRPVFRERKDRLHIVTRALVTKVLTKPIKNKETPEAYGVQFLKYGKTTNVLARKDIIISAGAVGTPHLLLLSGIGPKDHLNSLNIPVIADLPGVGSNLQDHVGYIGSFVASKIQKPGVNVNKISPEVQYILEGKGPLAEAPYMLMHARSSYSGTPTSLSTKKRPFPDLQLYVIPTQSTAFLFAAFLQHAKSRGHIRLKSTNPEEYPVIDPQYFSNKDDATVLVDGFRVMERFEKSRAFAKAGVKMVMSTSCNGTEHAKLPRSDEFYRCLIREECVTGNHQCCTAKIGPPEDRYSVVDSRLRVYGVSRLRIADASVMPHLPSVNTQAPIYMIGEKAADMIKKDWNLQ